MFERNIEHYALTLLSKGAYMGWEASDATAHACVLQDVGRARFRGRLAGSVQQLQLCANSSAFVTA